MSLDLVELRKRIADAASAADGLEDSKHYRPDQATSGVLFWVETTTVERSTLGTGRWTVTLEATLLISGGWDRSKQEKTDTMLPLVWLAIEADRTLAGLICSLEILTAVVLREIDEGLPLGVRYTITAEV